MKNPNSCAFKTSIGGQALIEGILMRGPKKQAIVCRTADGLVEKTEELKFIKDRYPILGWPLIRGCAIFLSSMINGMNALTYSASLLSRWRSRASRTRSISGSRSIFPRKRPKTSSSAWPWCWAFC